MAFSDISRLFDRVDRNIWIVTAAAGDRRGGLVATFVMPASIVTELPRVLVGIGKLHATWKLIEASGAFALHLIDETQLDWVWRFGTQSGATIDKLDSLHVAHGASGSPLLVAALGWLDCRVESRMDTGDRTVYLAEVSDGGLRSDRAPLDVRRLLELAPREKLQQLKTQLDDDAKLDAQAIRAFRAHAPR